MILKLVQGAYKNNMLSWDVGSALDRNFALLTFYDLLDLAEHRSIIYGLPVVLSHYMTPLRVLYQPQHLTGLFGEKIIIGHDLYKFIKDTNASTREELEIAYSKWWPSLYGLSRPIISIA